MFVKLLFLCLATTRAYAIVCTEDFCDGVSCAAVTEDSCDGRIARNGGFCGCCDLCVKQLAKGESCFATLLMGFPATVECGSGLTCELLSRTCEPLLLSKRESQTCLERVQQLQSAAHLLGRFIPTCADDGSYTGRQCQGSVCFCVDRNGEEIPGYSTPIGQAADMDCQCARDKDAYLQTGLIGKLFFCADNGNYLKYACTGSVCYCVDSLGNRLAGSTSVNIGDVDSLQC